MKISSLTNGQEVIARVGKAGEEDVNWGQWQRLTLVIQFDTKGKIAFLTVREIPGWAEYTPADYDEKSDCLLVEDYYLQIQ